MRKASTRPLRILAPTRYPWRFNSPRHSRHAITNQPFLPMNKIDERIEGFTIFPPTLRRYDLVHAFNRIPVGRTPYLIGFESHLPRAFSLESTAYFRTLTKSLAGKRCRGIVAISRFSERIFRKMHAESAMAEELYEKLEMRYPNIEIPAVEDQAPDLNGPLQLVFVGHHFARKGGCVAVRLAELAQEAGVDMDGEFPVVVPYFMREIVEPTVRTMAAEGTPYSGVLYAGLMLTKDGPQLIEYNARFGDPECQVLMMRLESDLVELMQACAQGRLGDIAEPALSGDFALTVVMAAEGYPGTPRKGGTIDLGEAEAGGAKVFHAGTKLAGETLTSSGGRVLNVTARGASATEAQAKAYEAVDAITFPDGFCRRDIGQREVRREQA